MTYVPDHVNIRWA